MKAQFSSFGGFAVAQQTSEKLYCTEYSFADRLRGIPPLAAPLHETRKGWTPQYQIPSK
jgi:hypothetical protein